MLSYAKLKEALKNRKTSHLPIGNLKKKNAIFPCIIPLISRLKPKTICCYGDSNLTLFDYLNTNWPESIGKAKFIKPDALSLDGDMHDKRVDLSICTNILEHISPEELTAFLTSLSSYSSYVCFCISCTIPEPVESGSFNIYPPKWWQNHLKSFFNFVHEEICDDLTACIFLASQNVLKTTNPENDCLQSGLQKVQANTAAIQEELLTLKSYMLLKDLSPQLPQYLFMPQGMIFDEQRKSGLKSSLNFGRGYAKKVREWYVELSSHLVNDSLYATKKDHALANLIEIWQKSRGTALETESCDAIFRYLYNENGNADADDSELIHEFFAVFAERPNRWLPKFTNTWLRYIIVLLGENNKDTAKKILSQYIEKHKLKDLHLFLPVAALAIEMGHKNNAVSKSAKLYATLLTIEATNSLQQTLKNKKVALVGNGPQEIGRKNCNTINSYDVVMRFNKFDTSEKFREDYGHKTTIWAMNYVVSKQDLSEIPTGDIPIIYYNFLLRKVKYYPKLLKDIETHIAQRKTVIFRDEALSKKLWEVLGIPVTPPTLGTMMLAVAKHTNSELSESDIFGFSFKDKKSNNGFHKIHHYFTNKLLSESTHDFDNEKLLCQNILNCD